MENENEKQYFSSLKLDKASDVYYVKCDNPLTINFAGTVATYDGSSPITINIPTYDGSIT